MAGNSGTILSPDFYSETYPKLVSLPPQVENAGNTEIDFIALLKEKGVDITKEYQLQKLIEQFTIWPFLQKADYKTGDFDGNLGKCTCIEMGVWFQIQHGADTLITIPTWEELDTDCNEGKIPDFEKYRMVKAIKQLKQEMLVSSFCWIPFIKSQVENLGRLKQASIEDTQGNVHHLSSLDSSYTDGESSPTAKFTEAQCILFFGIEEN